MKHAYYVHNEALKAYQSTVSHIEKRAIAMTYFEKDAAIVNAEMKKKLEEEK